MLGTCSTLNYSFGGEPVLGELRQNPIHLLDEAGGKDMLSLLQSAVILGLLLGVSAGVLWHTYRA